MKHLFSNTIAASCGRFFYLVVILLWGLTQVAVAGTTPNAFSFSPVSGLARHVLVISNTITVTGINAPSPISITGVPGDTFYYDINGGTLTNVPGTVSNGDTVKLWQYSPSLFSHTNTVTLTIGGVSAAFSATTMAVDTTPDAFSFTPQTNVALGAVVTSNTITVTGVNCCTNVSIVGGTYSVNGGAYTAAAAPGSLVNGDTVTVRLTASASNSTTTTATLTMGGVIGAFNVTTVAVSAPPPPPVPTIPLLSMAPVCGLGAWPAVLNMGTGVGPAFTTDLVALLANVVGQPLAFVEQSACGTMTLSGYNGGKLALLPSNFQGTGDPRANGVYTVGNGQYQVVRNGQSITISPAPVRVDQLTALFPGLSATQGDNGVITATLGGVTYVLQPSVQVQLDPATGSARLVMGGDGYWHFIDAQGNNQILYPAFSDPASLRVALWGQDVGATLAIQLDGSAAIGFKGQRYALVPDLTLSGVPAERVGQSTWQDSALRFWVANAQPLGTAQGFTLKP